MDHEHHHAQYRRAPPLRPAGAAPLLTLLLHPSIRTAPRTPEAALEGRPAIRSTGSVLGVGFGDGSVPSARHRASPQNQVAHEVAVILLLSAGVRDITLGQTTDSSTMASWRRTIAGSR